MKDDNLPCPASLPQTPEEIHDIYNQAPCGYHSLDKDGVFVRVNDTELSWLGYARKDIIGKMKFQDILTPEGLKVYAAAGMGKGPVDDLECDLVCQGGTLFPVRLRSRVGADGDGNFTGSRAAVFETAERKRAEQAGRAMQVGETYLSTLFNAVQVGIILIDAQTRRIVDVNPVAEDMFGKKKEHIINHVCHQYICPMEKGHCPVLDLDQKIDSADRMLLKGNGEVSPILKTVVPVTINDRNFLLESFMDMSEHKRMEQALRQSAGELKAAYETLVAFQARLVEAEKMSSLGQLAAGVAHEINNPLGYISNNLVILGQYAKKFEDLLQTYSEWEAAARPLAQVQGMESLQILDAMKLEVGLEAALPEFHEVLAETREGVERVKKIIIDLKTFARADKENLELDDIHAVLDLAVNIIRHEVKYGIELIQERGDLPRIMCYPRQLGQVFINLLMNAVQAVDPRHGRIHVRTFMREGMAVMEFEDNGCGIAPDVLPRVFEPFFTTKEVGKGTGLGLSIAYGIVRKHGGEILVRSVPGGGAVFTVSLPAGGA